MNSHQRRVRRRLYARVMDTKLTTEQWLKLGRRETVWLRLSHRKRVRVRAHFDKRPTREQIQFAVKLISARDRDLLARLKDDPRCPKCGSVYHTLQAGELGWCYACRGEP